MAAVAMTPGQVHCHEPVRAPSGPVHESRAETCEGHPEGAAGRARLTLARAETVHAEAGRVTWREMSRLAEAEESDHGT